MLNYLISCYIYYILAHGLGNGSADEEAATKTDDLNLILKTHMVEGKSYGYSKSSIDIHMYIYINICKHTQSHTDKDRNVIAIIVFLW